MRKGIIFFIAMAFIFAFVTPVKADTIFNETSKWISSWGKECSGCMKSSTPAKAAAPCKESMCYKKDVLNNTVPMCTAKSGNTSARKATSCKMMPMAEK